MSREFSPEARAALKGPDLSTYEGIEKANLADAAIARDLTQDEDHALRKALGVASKPLPAPLVVKAQDAELQVIDQCMDALFQIADKPARIRVIEYLRHRFG